MSFLTLFSLATSHFVCTALVRFFFAFLSKDPLQSVKQSDVSRVGKYKANKIENFCKHTLNIF